MAKYFKMCFPNNTKFDQKPYFVFHDNCWNQLKNKHQINNSNKQNLSIKTTNINSIQIKSI